MPFPNFLVVSLQEIVKYSKRGKKSGQRSGFGGFKPHHLISLKFVLHGNSREEKKLFFCFFVFLGGQYWEKTTIEIEVSLLYYYQWIGLVLW